MSHPPLPAPVLRSRRAPPATASWSCRWALALLAASAVAPAQFSRARSDFEKVRSAQGNLNLDKERSDSLSAAKSLYEACGALMDSLANCGRELAEFSGAYADERGKPRRASATVRGQAEVTRAAADAWLRKLGSTESHKTEGEKVLAQANELTKQWSELTRRVDEAKSWLVDGLRNATRERDRIMQDCRPIEDAQNAAWARLTAAQRADNRADEEHDRAIERVVAAEAKENEAYERYSSAAGKGGKTEEVWALRQQWNRAANDENDALAAAFTALQAHQSIRDELKAAYAQLGATQREMRAFTAATDANKIVETYNLFVRWNELFEKEFN